jgi:hypothetical protein
MALAEGKGMRGDMLAAVCAGGAMLSAIGCGLLVGYDYVKQILPFQVVYGMAVAVPMYVLSSAILFPVCRLRIERRPAHIIWLSSLVVALLSLRTGVAYVWWETRHYVFMYGR